MLYAAFFTSQNAAISFYVAKLMAISGIALCAISLFSRQETTFWRIVTYVFFIIATLLATAILFKSYSSHRMSIEQGALSGHIIAYTAVLIFFNIIVFSKQILNWTRTHFTESWSHFFFLGLFLELFILLIYNPFFIVASDPEFFNYPLEVLIDTTICFLAAYFICALIFYFAKDTCRIALTSLLYIILFTTIIYTTVVHTNYGTCSFGTLSDTTPLDFSFKNSLIDITVVLFVCFFLYMLLRFKKAHIIKYIICAEICSFIFFFATTAYQNMKNWNFSTSESLHKEIQKDMYSFSKEGKNILVLMSDMFTGDHFAKLLAEQNNISDVFDGFTYFNDCISSGALTRISVPTILGGEKIIPPNFHNNNKKSIMENNSKAIQENLLKINKSGYEIELINFIDSEKYSKFFNADAIKFINTGTEYIDEWIKKVNFDEDISPSGYPIVLAMSVFKALPLTLRDKIYDNGNWIGAFDHRGLAISHSIKELSFLESWTEYITNDSEQWRFKFVESLFTHLPWPIDPETGLPTRSVDSRITDITQYERYVHQHLAAERVTLSVLERLFTKMKELDIYDNTLIIIVSDHDFHDSFTVRGLFIDDEKGSDGKKILQVCRPNSLLLVKPFNSRGNLIVDTSSPMASYDVSSIIFSHIKFANGELPIPEGSAKDRFRYHLLLEDHSFSERLDQEQDYHGLPVVRIRGTMKDRDNWEIIKIDSLF